MQNGTPSNTIVERVAADLGKYPPFSRLEPGKILDIAASLSVDYHEEGEMLFAKGEQLGASAYMVMKGAVRLFDSVDGEEVLVELCDEGDLFGIRAIFGTSEYLLSAEVVEESLLFAIPVDKIKALVESEPSAAAFFTGAIARSVQNIEHSLMGALDHRRSDDDAGGPMIRRLLEHETLEVEPVRNVVTCPADITIREAAAIMAELNIGSIIVASDQKHPLGIITDTDLRKKVVALPGQVNERPVREIMSSPVYTISEGRKTVADMMMLMVRTKLRHFCITEDGTQESPVTGIISEHDIVTSEGSNPAVIMKALMQAEFPEQLAAEREKAEKLLRAYIGQHVAVDFIATIITEVNDALIVKAIELSIAGMAREGIGKPEVAFCWLSLGSEGRKEQLLRTDQDNAIIFAPPAPGREEAVRTWFVSLGQRVTSILESCGFSRCPAEIMASNPAWCQSLEGWMAYFRKWIGAPEPKALMNSTIFFDFRPVYGNFDLASELKSAVIAEIGRGRGFLQFFAQNAMQNPPPLGFFRNFLVEKSRDHANEFDIKARAMMPLSDAARVLAYEMKVPDFLSTSERFRRLAQLVPGFEELAMDAAMAYEFLIRLRTEQGLAHSDGGRYINPESLDKMQRQALRELFTTIGKVQSMLNLRFQLDYFRA